jgi:hypothetical protein
MPKIFTRASLETRATGSTSLLYGLLISKISQLTLHEI